MTIDEIRNYESTFILLPELEEADFKAITEKFTKLMQAEGGEIVSQEIWGTRKLAYPIKKRTSGYYVFTEFRAKASTIADLEREYEYDERVIRHLTVRLDKHAAAYNDKRRAKLKKTA